ncbi:MAG: serine/threonine-protein kinase RsbW [bacterium]|nr:serine/threonine-protein kinase RsbW [Solirubrobacteraceae bacterium]
MANAMQAGCLSMTVPASREMVVPLRRSVGALAAGCGATDDALWRIDQALSEACTNVVLHAYRRRPGQLRLTADVRGDVLGVTVADEGVGAARRRAHGSGGLGLGLQLIEQLADALTLEAGPGARGTVVRMRFGLRVDGAVSAVDRGHSARRRDVRPAPWPAPAGTARRA